MGKGEFGVLGMEQRIADEVRERTRPQGEENIACRYRCVGNKVFDPFKLAWEDCPLCAGLLVKKLGLSEEATEEDVLQRLNIPLVYKDKVLDVENIFRDGDYVHTVYTAESISRLKSTLSHLVELVYSGKGLDNVYFLNIQSEGIGDFIYPYLQKALRMGLDVCPFLPVTDLSIMMMAFRGDSYRAFLRRLTAANLLEGFNDPETYFAFLEKQGYDLARLYGLGMSKLRTADVLFLELPMTINSSDISDMQELVRARRDLGKGTVILSNYGRVNATIRLSLQIMFKYWDDYRIPYVELDLKRKSQVPLANEEVTGTAMDALNKFQVNTGLL